MSKILLSFIIFLSTLTSNVSAQTSQEMHKIGQEIGLYQEDATFQSVMEKVIFLCQKEQYRQYKIRLGGTKTEQENLITHRRSDTARLSHEALARFLVFGSLDDDVLNQYTSNTLDHSPKSSLADQNVPSHIDLKPCVTEKDYDLPYQAIRLMTAITSKTSDFGVFAQLSALYQKVSDEPLRMHIQDLLIIAQFATYAEQLSDHLSNIVKTYKETPDHDQAIQYLRNTKLALYQSVISEVIKVTQSITPVNNIQSYIHKIMRDYSSIGFNPIFDTVIEEISRTHPNEMCDIEL